VVKDAGIGEVRFMDAEEELKRAKHDCLLWVKGFHNIQRSTFFMEKFAEKETCRDQSIKEALFQAAIISYAKPFITTETTKGKVQLPTKPLQNTPLFEVNVHKHMVDLRHKLIAHDDLTAIEPKYAWVSLVDNSNPNGSIIPFQAHLNNSCISYPQERRDFDKMQAHVKAAYDGAFRYLDQRVTETRKLMLAHPKEARSVFRERPDSVLGIIAGDGQTTEFKIDISAAETHPILEVTTPHSPVSFGNYRHTTVNIRISFNGPQGSGFDGNSVSITQSER